MIAQTAGSIRRSSACASSRSGCPVVRAGGGVSDVPGQPGSPECVTARFTTGSYSRVAALTVALRRYGVETRYVWAISAEGETCNRRGVVREEVAAAVAERDDTDESG